MSLTSRIIPEKTKNQSFPETIKTNGETGRSGPVLECVSTSAVLGARSLENKLRDGLRAGQAAGLGGGSAPPLGTYAGFVSAPSPDGPGADPALVPVDALPAVYDRSAAITARFRCQLAARRLLPCERVANCLRCRQSGQDYVSLFYAAATGSAHFGGLQTCGSVISCPVCAAKVGERRRVEVRSAIDAWEARGGMVLMATFTVRHYAGDTLAWLLSGLKGALRRVYQGRQGQKFGAEYGVAGSISATETTWGSGTGYHPHIHQLLFLRPGTPADHSLMMMHYKTQWDGALRLEGMRGVTSAGVDFTYANADAADYVNKLISWDVEHELTKGTSKQARKTDRFTPAALLSSFADFMQTGDYDHVGRSHGEVWRDYALTMKGRHLLQWSRGLRAMLGLGVEKTDEKLEQETDATAVLLAQLNPDEWGAVLYFDGRAELVNIASADYPDFDARCMAVAEYVADLQYRLTLQESARLSLLRSAPALIGAVDALGAPVDVSEYTPERVNVLRSGSLRAFMGQRLALEREAGIQAVLRESDAWAMGLSLDEYNDWRRGGAVAVAGMGGKWSRRGR